MLSKLPITIFFLIISFQLTFTKHKVEEVDAKTTHKEHVFLIKTNLTKEEVQERLSNPKLHNDVDDGPNDADDMYDPPDLDDLNDTNDLNDTDIDDINDPHDLNDTDIDDINDPHDLNDTDDDDIRRNAVNDPSSNVQGTTSLKQKEKGKEKEGKKSKNKDKKDEKKNDKKSKKENKKKIKKEPK